MGRELCTWSSLIKNRTIILQDGYARGLCINRVYNTCVLQTSETFEFLLLNLWRGRFCSYSPWDLPIDRAFFDPLDACWNFVSVGHSHRTLNTSKERPIWFKYVCSALWLCGISQAVYSRKGIIGFWFLGTFKYQLSSNACTEFEPVLILVV